MLCNISLNCRKKFSAETATILPDCVLYKEILSNIIMLMRTLLLLFLLAYTFTLTAQETDRVNEIVIQLKPEADIEQFINAINLGRTANPKLLFIRTIVKDFNIHLLAANPDVISQEEMIAQLKKEGTVEGVQPNSRADFRSTYPNDPVFPDQWHLDKIQAFEAWDVTTGGVTPNGDTIVIAIMDRGCDILHEDIAPNLWVNRQEIPGDGIDNDLNGYTDDYYGVHIKNGDDDHPNIVHGCAVAGLAGAKGDNGLGVSGIMWNTRLLQISGAEFVDEIIEGYYYTYKMRKDYDDSNGAEGAYIVVHNYSAGISRQFCDVYPTWKSMYDSLGTVGILSVGATVNEDWNVDQIGDMPTTCPSDFLLTVTSTDRNDDKVEDAGFGTTHIDIGAPGTDIVSTRPNNEYGDVMEGTSWATPIVVGAVGLLYSAPCINFSALVSNDPPAAALQIKEILIQSAEKSPSLQNKILSGGRLDIYNALLLLDSLYGAPRTKLDIVRISPNPSNNFINVYYNVPDNRLHNIRLFDAVGRYLGEDEVPRACASGVATFDISDLPNGIYFLSIGKGKEVETKRFLKY